MEEKKRPKVGMGIFVIKDNKVLMQKRKGAHGTGCWSIPGGHLEFNESWEECASREVAEETGVKIKNIKLITATNDIFKKEDKHYVTIFMVSDYDSGEPTITEPEFCDGLDWFSWNSIPSNLFLPLKNLLDTGYNPFKQK